MNSSLDPKFFQILPTRSLSSAATLKKEKTKTQTSEVTTTSYNWGSLEERVAKARPDHAPEKLAAVTQSLQEALTYVLAESWQRARRVIADVTGDAQAISIIGPLSDSADLPDRLMREIDTETLQQALTQCEAGAYGKRPGKSWNTPHQLATLPAQPLTQLESVIDDISTEPSRPTALEHACLTVVKSLVRERCANLISPVRQKIEKELSFELTTTSEITRPVAKKTIGSAAVNKDVVELATQAIHDNNADAIVELLARSPNFTSDIVREALNGRNARAISALAWKAGLPAPVASAIQIHIALIPPLRAILSSADGSYALTTKELNWQLDFLKEKATALAA